MRKTVQISSELKKEYPNMDFSPNLVSQFEQFLGILEQWNNKMNLTAIRSMDEMIIKHLLDSLAVFNTSIGAMLSPPSRASLLDLGSGAGLPGILLQLVNPRLRVLSIDKSRRKICFQEFVKATMGLSNLTPLSERVETLISSGVHEKSMDFIVTRAFDQIKTIFKYSRFFLAENGYLILWKGKEWKTELAAVNEIDEKVFQLTESSVYRFGDGRFGGTILVFRRS